MHKKPQPNTSIEQICKDIDQTVAKYNKIAVRLYKIQMVLLITALGLMALLWAKIGL